MYRWAELFLLACRKNPFLNLFFWVFSQNCLFSPFLPSATLLIYYNHPDSSMHRCQINQQRSNFYYTISFSLCRAERAFLFLWPVPKLQNILDNGEKTPNNERLHAIFVYFSCKKRLSKGCHWWPLLEKD